VVAAIPAPAVPNPAGKEFGEPSWVKVIKTTTHNANNVPLANLISDDKDGDGLADWQNAEPDEVEMEWKLLQASISGNGRFQGRMLSPTEVEMSWQGNYQLAAGTRVA